MKKRNHKHEKRVKKLIVVCLLSAIILTVSTYAWFIGMQTVSVNAFEVKIAAAQGLALSIDGETFEDTVTINEGNYATAYTGNTNSWTALEPISTIGKMDAGTDGSISRMIVYEKSSLTASGGGYRLLSERLDNKTKEANGYVAFDLFIKNLSGEEYYTTNDVANEEAIYLTLDSNVGVGAAGTDNTGIENSVRVAFAQIGRVKSDTAATTVQQIKCADTYAEDAKGDYKLNEGVYEKVAAGTGTHKRVVTNICRDATIWEPNDADHVANAISWYNNSCKARTIENGTDKYSGTCTEVVDGNFYQTYAVAKAITENKADNGRDYEVDVYDGVYNSYKQSTTDVVDEDEGTEGDGYLQAVDTITDSEKLLNGTSRPTFMTLAPNSITKVRVYVYIEGQDVDNYDFASLGKQIKVNFGFTKERFTTEDFDYQDTSAEEDNNPDLFRYFHVAYEATGTVSGLPTAGSDLGLPDGISNPVIAEYNASTKILKISKSVTKSFEFKDGETVKVAERSVTAEGYINWTIKNKEA